MDDPFVQHEKPEPAQVAQSRFEASSVTHFPETRLMIQPSMSELIVS
jgi:hypothetical protein